MTSVGRKSLLVDDFDVDDGGGGALSLRVFFFVVDTGRRGGLTRFSMRRGRKTFPVERVGIEIGAE